MENIFIIAGLGNPGSKYENTRHNIGFKTIDLLSKRHGIKVTRIKHKALTGEGVIEGQRTLLVKPQTFMNLSGESLREVVEWYKLPPERLIVVYDDIDLAVGKIRVRQKGSSGTHNGMRSVLCNIRTEDFPRVRIGTGRPPEGWELADYVLGCINGDESGILYESVTRAADAIEAILGSGVEAAMNKFNI